jgi:hypothetical protein
MRAYNGAARKIGRGGCGRTSQQRVGKIETGWVEGQ